MSACWTYSACHVHIHSLYPWCVTVWLLYTYNRHTGVTVWVYLDRRTSTWHWPRYCGQSAHRIGVGSRTWSVSTRCRDPACQSDWLTVFCLAVFKLFTYLIRNSNCLQTQTMAPVVKKMRWARILDECPNGSLSSEMWDKRTCPGKVSKRCHWYSNPQLVARATTRLSLVRYSTKPLERPSILL